ncbi:lamin tail domain-containing protein [Paenibacillus sp. F411]|uniref:choice-of-anchor I family protein n=1 Tax=Paenibacillus sp. F411 TaxID=2820239 RepID=UPI001AAF615F|nr:choice-of-anchor I family protein [Paenibacillus sp. F411]MBO2944550.1 lamin tail domain-containing protein [Paenibacillus sp. F411]
MINSRLRRKRILGFIAGLLVFVQLVVSFVGVHAAEESAVGPDTILIHQVYGGGGKSDTPISHSFIELYNPTEAPISLEGWKIEYSSLRSAGNPGTTAGEWVALELSGIIPSHASYLIRGAAETTSVSLLQMDSFDLDWTGRYIDNDQYNVRLVNGSGGVVDQVTVKEAGKDGVEGQVIPSISKQKSIRRINFNDTNQNNTDFEVLEYKSQTPEFIALHRPRSLADGAWGLTAPTEPTPNPVPNPAPTPQIPAVPAVGGEPAVPGGLSYWGSFFTGSQNEDGGAAEIVKYNPDNGNMYLVNGNAQTIDIISLGDWSAGSASFSLKKQVSLSSMIPGFTFGDVTSVDIHTGHQLIAVAVQEQDYAKNGAVLLLNYDGDYVTHLEVGVQPDMITFTPDGQYVLTADEGEPRSGYGPGAVDPKGSVSIVDLRDGINSAKAVQVTFEAWDAARAELVNHQVILKKNTLPSVDLEPEYIAVADNSKTAYVTLQEANAVAVLDIGSMKFTSIKGLGFKDHSLPGNELDIHRNGQIEIHNYSVFGAYMPDGAATANIGGVTYLLTPNEGDAREWAEYANIGSTSVSGGSIDTLKNEEHDGLENDKTYILGGRSFSIWNAETLELVYDSGSDFEKITAERYPHQFNVSNDNLTLDHRSSKKGPEPEDIKVLEVEGKVYAFIGLERIGGIMVYDITNPAEAKFFDYMNTRDYSAKIKGDVAPEGLAVIKAADSPTGYPLLLAAHEVSGTVAVYQLHQGYVEPDNDVRPLKLDVQKSTASGMSVYQYSVSQTPGAPVYSSGYDLVVQVYEGADYTTPGLTLIKHVQNGTDMVSEEIRIGQNKKVKIMVVSAVDGENIQVLADAYGVQ